MFSSDCVLICWHKERNLSLRSAVLLFRYFRNAVYFLRIRWRTSPSIQGGELVSCIVLVGTKLVTIDKNLSFHCFQQLSILSVRKMSKDVPTRLYVEQGSQCGYSRK